MCLKKFDTFQVAQHEAHGLGILFGTSQTTGNKLSWTTCALAHAGPRGGGGVMYWDMQFPVE